MEVTDRPGLTPAEAADRLARVGPNRLFTPAPVRFWAIAAEEIREPMILLLLVVGVFYSLWGGLGDAVTIFVVILLLVRPKSSTSSVPSVPSVRLSGSPRRGLG